MTWDLNALSIATTVWEMSSLLTQVTVVPTPPVTMVGPKVKLSILAVGSARAGAAADGEGARSQRERCD
jgi:hypothetical protein